MSFRAVDTRASFVALEDRIGDYWRSNDIKKQALAHGEARARHGGTAVMASDLGFELVVRQST
jgi:hypothetical protein